MAHDTARSLRRSLQDELPAHGQWVQKLARSLVRDEASAEDLAQEAQLAALLHGQSIRGALGPFLARVTRNFARRGWRDAARRAAREREAARPEALPGVDESAARLEIQRRLVGELAALEPAMRHALVRRYFDGWTAARIARESGEPAATVRWRLQRGLAELRVRLDQKSGGDGIQWQLALLPVCGQATPWTALEEVLRPLAGAGTIQGALTMKAATQALAASVLVAAVGVGVWLSVEREEAPRVAELDEPLSRPGKLHGTVESVVEPAPTLVVARESVVPEPSTEKSAAAIAPESSTAARVLGRCVDERLVPVDGARVSQVGEAARSAAAVDGLFALEVMPNRWDACTLQVEAAGFATRFLEARLPAQGTANLGDVILQPGGSVRGRVFGPNGVPYPGASVAVTQPDLRVSLEAARRNGPSDTPFLAGVFLDGVSGDGGRFEIAGVGLDPVRVWAGAEGMRYAVSPPIEVRERQATDEIELHLEPIRSDDRITGIVLSPEGEPVPHARVSGMERSGGGMTSFAVLADASGRFEIAAKEHHVYDLSAGDPEDRWASVEAGGVRPGTHDLELVFQEARWIAVRVHAEDGVPIEEYELRAQKEDGDEIGWAKKEPRSAGFGRLRAPSVPFFVCVDARGFAPVEEGPFQPEAAPETLEFELLPEPGVRGRVLAGGEPIAGARVALHDAEPGSRIEHQGYPSLVSPRASDKTSADAEGRFVLRLRQRGTFVVRAEAEGYAASDSGPLELDPQTGRTDLELVLGRGGALEGRVLMAAGRDPAGVIVALNRGDAFPRTVRTDEEGRFGFERLTPGPWQLSRGRMEVSPKGGGSSFSAAKTPTVIPFNCTIREGETTYQDLDLRNWEPSELSGLLLVNGAPAKDWSVSAWPGAKESMVGTPPSTSTATDGSFALTLDEAGALRLSFSPPAEMDAQGRIDVLTELHPGANEWHADFAMGRLSGRCLSPISADEQSLFYSTAEGVTPSCWLPILPDEQGLYVLPFVPAGKGSIERLGQANGDWSWATLLEAEIPARGERVLDVP